MNDARDSRVRIFTGRKAPVAAITEQGDAGTAVVFLTSDVIGLMRDAIGLDGNRVPTTEEWPGLIERINLVMNNPRRPLVQSVAKDAEGADVLIRSALDAVEATHRVEEVFVMSDVGFGWDNAIQSRVESLARERDLRCHIGVKEY